MQFEDYSAYYKIAAILLVLGVSILVITAVVVLIKKKQKKSISVITNEEIIKPENESKPIETNQIQQQEKPNDIEETSTDIFIDSSDFTNSSVIAENLKDSDNENELDDELTGELSSDILKEKNKGAKN